MKKTFITKEGYKIPVVSYSSMANVIRAAAEGSVICPKRIALGFLVEDDKKLKVRDETAMHKGRYAESLLLGCARGGEKVAPIGKFVSNKPKKTGAKKADYLSYIKKKYNAKTCKMPDTTFVNMNVKDLKDYIYNEMPQDGSFEMSTAFKYVKQTCIDTKKKIQDMGLLLKKNKLNGISLAQLAINIACARASLDWQDVDVLNPVKSTKEIANISKLPTLKELGISHDEAIELGIIHLFRKENIALYDYKYTEASPKDSFYGWAEPQKKWLAGLQSIHYTWTKMNQVKDLTGISMKVPNFYFVVNSPVYIYKESNSTIKDTKVLDEPLVQIFKHTHSIQSVNKHQKRVDDFIALMKIYAKDNWKARGNSTKCAICPFRKECPDRVNEISIGEVVWHDIKNAKVVKSVGHVDYRKFIRGGQQGKVDAGIKEVLAYERSIRD